MSGEKLDKIKEVVLSMDKISEEEKSLSVQKIEEWYAEDQGMTLLTEQLSAISKEIMPILKEMGLL
jgi:hypothetical protein